MTEYIIAKEEEVKEGERIVAQIEGREIGVFNIDGEFVAYANWCPHQGGPCAEGNITGTVEATFDRDDLEVSMEWTDEDVLNCPWHGWEYNIKTGECLSRNKVRLPSYNVKVEEGNIVLDL